MKKVLLLVILVLVALVAFCPWLSDDYSHQIAKNYYNNVLWAGVTDGCGTVGDSFTIHFVPFGRVVELNVLCGLVPIGAKPHSSSVFVSFLGTTHDLSK